MIAVCRLEEVPDGGTHALTVEGSQGPRDVFLHRAGSTVRAFENACPHLGTPLDWAPGRFLSEDGTHFVCATHGAQFRLEDGHCVFGPCVNDRLTAIPAVVRADTVFLALDDAL